MVDADWKGPYLNIDPARQPVLNHRSGWAFALQALAPLYDPRGIFFDSFLERTFSWYEKRERRQGVIPYREPWIGVMHNPPGVPRWHDYENSPQAILARDSFRQSLPYCRGLFTLSEYLCRWLVQRVNVPVSALIHPTETPALKFSRDAFRGESRPAVIQVGWWLRRLHSIFRLRAKGYRKLMLAVGHRHFEHMLARERSRSSVADHELTSVAVLPFVSNDEYDRWLSHSVVFCDLIDSSANNVVIECIVRNTPILINRLPAVEEYLGRDYPLYFSTLDEASAKLSRRSTVLAAHEYLRALPKERFSQQAFRDAFMRSEVYRRLCGEAPRTRQSGAMPRATVGNRPSQPTDMSLVLSRAACGAVYVERAEFDAQDTRVARSGFERLWCGLPLNAVRRLTLRDFIRHVSPEKTPEAKLAYDALNRALERT
ncbi:MAG: hypothetical protein B7Z73_11205 [Planctomycetia bacterium 21-64-5]|nr:MAG: hypothetical protein B7Z73_11205 [Planctomycetia bacterium 21-64-5]